MFAAPIHPSANILGSKDVPQYRPAKDLDAFNALLPPPIEFVEGSSSGLLALSESKYQAINDAPAPRPDDEEPTASTQTRTPSKASKHSSTSSSVPPKSALYTRHIDVTWPSTASRGCGLVNTGNTCFLNSALQCLLHTPPLLHVLEEHGTVDPCPVPKGAFCMACSMRQLMKDFYRQNYPLNPYVIATKLQHIAKHMRRGRQEDSHEFLRYAVDALQKSCLAGHSPKIDHKLAETTWVHKIFGGRLRSRVTCLSCHYNSDTFDSILDLSVDIYGVTTLKDALRKFVAVDHLKGADKYKCEKCKKHVTANKQFTVDEAPMVLTVHLKRFSPMGRKIGHSVAYPERLSLQSVMSEGQFGPMYSLFGVISHAGGGPNSGHYYAHVKDSKGQWFEMNDESVSRGNTPLNMKNAYMLFYVRDKGQALQAAVASTAASKAKPSPLQRSPVISNMKRRKRVDSDDEDDRTAATVEKSASFIGPRMPSPGAAEHNMQVDSDPQAELLKRKIAEKQVAAIPPPISSPTKPSAALQSLSQYADDDDDDSDQDVDLGEKVSESVVSTAAPPPGSPTPTSLVPETPSDSATDAPRKTPSVVTPIPTSSFYATPSNKDSTNGKKRKSPEPDDSETLGDYVRRPFPQSSSPHHAPKRFTGINPYTRLSGGNNLSGGNTPAVQHRYGKKHNRNGNRRPRHI